MKKCSKCKVKKPLTEFKKDSTRKDGYAYQCKQCGREYYQQTKSKYKQYYLDTKEEHLERARLNYIENKERYTQYNKEWALNNRDKLREYDKKYYYTKVVQRRMRLILKNTLIQLRQNKTSTTIETLGYTANELREYLDKQGMDWSRHQVDHKIPISWFKDNTPPHIVNDLRNLQPLTEEENKSKSNTFCSPVEDSYINEVKKWVKPQYKDKLA